MIVCILQIKSTKKNEIICLPGVSFDKERMNLFAFAVDLVYKKKNEENV